MSNDYKTRYSRLKQYESGKEQYIHDVWEIFNDKGVKAKINFFISTAEIFNAQFVKTKEKQEAIIKEFLENMDQITKVDYFFNFVNSDYLKVDFLTL